jgi:hypothetical protein
MGRRCHNWILATECANAGSTWLTVSSEIPVCMTVRNEPLFQRHGGGRFQTNPRSPDQSRHVNAKDRSRIGQERGPAAAHPRPSAQNGP